ncbi:hypothetical protein Trydic_g3420 [Trypoxylus dichotomus]
MVRYKHSVYQLIILMDLINFAWSVCESVGTARSCRDISDDGSCYNKFDEAILRCNPFTFDDVRSRYTSSYNVQYSNIYEIKPASFRNSENLQRLTMARDNITILEPGSFHGLTNLHFLNLSYNNIQTMSKGVFTGLYNLRILDLSYNDIEVIDSSAIVGTDGLTYLYLNHNNIFDIPSFRNECQKLKHLDISNNRIEGLQFIESCEQLRYLNVANNNLTNFPSDSINAPIFYLDISGNNLNEIQGENLIKLVDLKVLNLSSTSISKLSVGTFSPLEKLEVLDISSNNLSYLPDGFFYDIGSSLRKLDVSNNRLSYFRYEGYPHLTEIGLNHNLWTCDSLSVIVKEQRAVIKRGNAYNTTNILGIACDEEVKGFRNDNVYNSSDLNNLRNEYLKLIVKNQIDMRDTFTELKKFFLNQTSRPQINQMEFSRNKDLLLDLKSFLNATDLNIQGYQNSIHHQTSRVEDSLTRLAEVLESLENNTAMMASVEKQHENDVKQMIELQKVLVDLARRNYSTNYWKKFEGIQNDLKQTLVGIKEVLTTKEQQQIGTESPLTAMHPQAYQTSSMNRSEIVALYCIFVTLLLMLIIILFILYRKYNYVIRSSNEENNPFSSIAI